MGSLQWLYMAAELMENTGLNPYAHRGAHGQSLRMATDYYACFAKYAGFTKVITAQNSSDCPDAMQYFAVVVNGVEPNVLIGAYRFPEDNELSAWCIGKGLRRTIRPSAGADPIRQMARIGGSREYAVTY